MASMVNTNYVIIFHLNPSFVFLFQLANTEEFIDGTFTGNLGEVLIR